MDANMTTPPQPASPAPPTSRLPSPAISPRRPLPLRRPLPPRARETLELPPIRDQPQDLAAVVLPPISELLGGLHPAVVPQANSKGDDNDGGRVSNGPVAGHKPATVLAAWEESHRPVGPEGLKTVVVERSVAMAAEREMWADWERRSGGGRERQVKAGRDAAMVREEWDRDGDLEGWWMAERKRRGVVGLIEG
ncbi:hypothetical protein N0V88_001161 [Collariella sp. IMI 366227]|nr:hypothetical protein N0V88_001161 [Collariella sp. IMI 366227]